MAATVLDADSGDSDEQTDSVLADWVFHSSGGEKGR